MRRFFKAFDGLVRRGLGVYEFSDDPDCLLRIQVASLSHPLHMPDTDVPAGADVLFIHLWNEHVPPLPPQGADVAWGLRTCRRLIGTLRDIAALIQHDPRLADVQAIGGHTILIPQPGDPGGEGLIRRLGFTVMPYYHPLGRFGEFWENLYTWGLMWAYNPVSLRGRRFWRTRRYDMWMSRETLMRRYGDRAGEMSP